MKPPHKTILLLGLIVGGFGFVAMVAQVEILKIPEFLIGVMAFMFGIFLAGMVAGWYSSD